ncbi:hypothetical protein KC343_g737 [Hortaea werneckii]|nr:hypothetical protein KC352_g4497 [Hortaea werneckii]KAI7572431.1 hypothetical protein KC317_g769 [Hortaea werneckii]KAI7627500.1 hypothetical protein KC346_g714 [Hortaea werneckii]KAI7637395.1 hypothetical protein KC343_g737 [Hortaea werneckii]KAI7683102.1 hypothetical protein KC319_g639 [Hortaea werneckii]
MEPQTWTHLPPQALLPPEKYSPRANLAKGLSELIDSKGSLRRVRYFDGPADEESRPAEEEYRPRLTGWLKGHDCDVENWAAMQAQGGEQYGKAVQQERQFDQNLCAFAMSLDIFPEEDKDAKSPKTFKSRMNKRQSLREKSRASDRYPSSELTRLSGCKPDMKAAQDLFCDGLENACKDHSYYSEFAVREHIEGLESKDDVPLGDPKYLRLLPHQRDGIGWLEYFLKKYKGALLADQMGLGKTLQVVAVLLRQLRAARQDGRTATSLIIVPLPLLDTWEAELAKAPELKVYLYHGLSAKEKSAYQIRQYDVVLTTYDTVVSEWKRLKKVQTAFGHCASGKKGIWELTNRAQEDLWYAECLSKGLEKIKEPKYEVLQVSRTSAPIFGVDWETVVADEAHTCRNHESIRAMALVDLNSNMRIAITGTPMQNSKWDLYSIIRFLRIRPWCNRDLFKAAFASNVKSGYGKDNKNKQVEIILSGTSRAFTLRRLHQDYFEDRPMSSMHPPIEYKHFIELDDEAQVTQEPTKDLWDPLMIEGRKANQRAKVHRKRKAGSDEDDNENEKSSGGAREREPGVIFRQMFEARMHCVHPDLIAHAKYGESIWVSAEEYDRAQMRAERSWQDSDGVTNEIQATRGAIFEDYQAEEQTEGDANNEDRRASYLRNHQERRDHFRRHLRSKPDGYRSDKISPIVEVIRQAHEDTDTKVSQITGEVSKKTHLANAKTIVFAEFLSQLDLLAVALEDELGIQPLRYDGSCTAEARRQAAEEHEEVGKDFSKPWVEPSKRTIFLATMKSCAEGPNLPHTTTVVFIAPSWDPFMMDHCKSRACCLTNRNQVSVHYFSCLNSMEMRLVENEDFKRKSVNRVNDEIRLRRGSQNFRRWKLQTFVNKLDKGQHKLNALIAKHQQEWDSA